MTKALFILLLILFFRGLKYLLLGKRLQEFGIALMAWILLSSWGYVGHEKISEGSATFFTEEMDDFHQWASYIIAHASDPDKRKSEDKTEGAKHYIDIDNYQTFIDSGYVNTDLNVLIEKHGYSFVEDQGFLPWATITTYDSLVACFVRRDFDRAKYFAADLSHYVADGFMPLHITKNYNGQFTNNDGIHSRYESQMIGRYVGQIEFKKEDIDLIESVPNYIFNYIYESYEYKDTILLGDDFAKTVNSNTSSTAYNVALWEKTENCTQILFNGAAKSLTSLIYAAWHEAGSPNILIPSSKKKLFSNGFSIQSQLINSQDGLILNFHADEDVVGSILVVDLDGRELLDLKHASFDATSSQKVIPLNYSNSAIYIIKVEVRGAIYTAKIRGT